MSGAAIKSVELADERTNRLCALHALSQWTAAAGVMSLLGPWLIVATLIPLHIYLAVHDARSLGVGRWGAAGLGAAAVLPLANTLILVVLSQRLARVIESAGYQRGRLGFCFQQP